MKYFDKKNLKNCILGLNSKIRNVVANLNNSSMQIVLIQSQDKSFLGVITDGDVRRAILRGLDLNSPITTLIKKNPTVVSGKTQLKTIAYLMKNKSLQHVPVVDSDNLLIGLYSLNNYGKIISFNNSVVIMAGGFGNRLKPYTNTCPKAMLKIGGKPILEHIIENLKSQGFKKIFISVNYLSENIINYFKSGKNFNISIQYIKEESPLGTIGSLRLLENNSKKPVIVINGDTFTTIDLREMLNFHIKNKSHATMAVKTIVSSNPYGVVKTKGLFLDNFKEKPVNKIYINTGVYIVSNSAIKIIKKKIDAPEFLMNLKKKKKKVIIFPAHEDWNEIGTIENYKNANKKMANE
jgi:dTDP-glucose pyrophosphorylase